MAGRKVPCAASAPAATNQSMGGSAGEPEGADRPAQPACAKPEQGDGKQRQRRAGEGNQAGGQQLAQSERRGRRGKSAACAAQQVRKGSRRARRARSISSAATASTRAVAQ